MRPLSILHLCSARKYVGEAARVVELASTQLELGHKVMVIGRKKHSVVDACERHRIPCFHAHMESRCLPWRDYADVRQIRRLLREREVDILHVHRGKDHWLSVWARAGLLRAIPIIRSRHVITPVKNHFANRWLFTHGTDGIDCVSRAVRQSLESSLPWLDLPVRVIRGGMRIERLRQHLPDDNIALRRSLHLPEPVTVVSLLGRIDEVKGHIHLIRAMPAVLRAHPEVVFLFAFPRQSTYRQVLEAEAKRLGVQGAIRWLSEQDSIAPLLNATDIGVIASIGSEGWSRVAVEFMHCGIPVVSTSVGSLPEIVRHGETGLIVRPCDPPAMASALLSLLDQPELRNAFSAAARPASAEFTCMRVAEETDRFYRDLLEAKGVRV